MNQFRAVVLVAIFSATALTLVCLRCEQTRCIARIQEARHLQMQLRKTLNQQQLQVARLRGPQQVKVRTARFGLNVRPPLEGETQDPGILLATSRP